MFYFVKAGLVLAPPAHELVVLKEKELSSEFPPSPGTGNSQVLPKGAPSPVTSPLFHLSLTEERKHFISSFILLFFPSP